MVATYDFPVQAAENAQATVTVGSNSYQAGMTVAEDGYSITVNVGSVLTSNSVANNTQFSLDITGIVPADTTNTTVEELSGNYIYRASLPTCTANPTDGNSLATKTSPVTFTFSENVTYGSLSFMSGSRLSPVYVQLDGSDVPSTTVTATPADSYWSVASNPTYLTISLDDIKGADGYYIPNVSATYSYTENTGVAVLTNVLPSPNATTYQDAYDAWFIRMYFSAPVSLPESGTVATVKFYDDMDEENGSVELEGWDVTAESVGGENYVEILVPDVPVGAEEFSYAIFTLVGATSNGTLLNPQPSVTYYAELSSSQARAKTRSIGGSNETTGISSVTSSESSIVDIYSVQGTLVKKNVAAKNVNALPKGIYIIGGKKVVVK